MTSKQNHAPQPASGERSPGAESPELAEKCRLALGGKEGFVPMDPEQERELGRKAQRGDAEAAWTLVMANQNFVRSIAKRYRRESLDFEDLVAEGMLGLMDAAERFDPERGIKFISYGVWWVKRSILRYLRGFEHPVHVPKYKQYEMQEFWRCQRALATRLGRNPTHAELAADCGAGEEAVREFFALSGRHESLDDEGSRTRDELAGSERRDAESAAILASCTERLHEVFPVLDERERFIVRQRFGLDGEAQRTLASIGEELFLTKERIRQIERLACDKLLAAIESLDAPVAAKTAPVPALGSQAA